jgi:hypothetical protein
MLLKSVEVKSELVGKVKQLAVSVEFAVEAVHAVIGDDKLQSQLAVLLNLCGVGKHFHTFAYRINTGSNVCPCSLDLDNADTARAYGVYILKIAKGRYTYTGKARSLKNCGALGCLHIHAVYFKVNCFHVRTLLSLSV